MKSHVFPRDTASQADTDGAQQDSALTGAGRRLSSPMQQTFARVMSSSSWIQERLSEALEPYDITHQQYNVLRILRSRHPGSTTATQVKQVMMDRNPDVTRLCDRLESKGLLSRRVNPNNRRQINVMITDQGLAMLARIEPILHGVLDRVNRLTPEENDQLQHLLDKMRSDPGDVPPHEDDESTPESDEA